MIRKLLVTALLFGLGGSLAAEESAPADPFASEDPFATAEEGGFEDEELRPISVIQEADYTRRISGGFLHVSRDNSMFGKYNGLQDKGARGWADVLMIARPGMDEQQDTRYWTLQGRNLGLNIEDLRFVYGRHGTWRVAFNLDNSLAVGNDSGRTPFDGAGSDGLTLPAGWRASNNTSGMSLAGDMARVRQEIERNQYALEFTRYFARWNMTTRLSHERKNGEQLKGSALYSNAANPHAALLPAPVDYDNTQLDVTVNIDADALQAQIMALHSRLDHRYDQVVWQNPYRADFGPLVDYPSGWGSLDAPMDNRFTQVRFNLSYLVSPQMRLRADGSMGASEIVDDFLPYSVNPNLRAAVGLPVTSLDDSLDTRHLYLSALTSPYGWLNLDFKYRFEERDNAMDVYRWQYLRGDGASQQGVNSSIANQPHDTSKETLSAEGTIRLPKSVRLLLGYDYTEAHRDFAAVEETKEDKYRGEIKLQPLEGLSVRFEGYYLDLSGSTYKWAEDYLNSVAVELIRSTTDDRRFNNHPLLRQYHLANQETGEFRLALQYLINPAWSLAFDGTYTDRQFDKSVLGLIDGTQKQFSLNLQYTPKETVSAYVWADYGNTEGRQFGRAFRGGIEKPANVVLGPLPEGSDPAREWEVSNTSFTRSFGLGAKGVVIPDKLTLSADIVYQRTRIETDYEVFGAPDLLGRPLPDIQSKVRQLSLAADWVVRQELNLRLAYDFYRYKSEDWAIDGVRAQTLDKVLTTGMTSPNEVISVLSLSVQYLF